MGADLRAALRPALALLLLFTLLTGLAYPLAILGLGQLIFPAQANGSLIRDGDRVIGSALVGQSFSSARYFNSRPSAAGSDGYDAMASAGSNLGPTSQALVDRTQETVTTLRGDGLAGPLPIDMVTASASGLDPHISPANAQLQVARIAAARAMPVERVRALVVKQTELPLAGVLGEPRVNVLLLNLALDREAANRQIGVASANRGQ